jgi:triacylglycerol esterase/lipase EstA (alpha/beta hydrolase family)
MLIALSSALPASAVPVRDNSAARPVYFVPGFSFVSGHHDCWNGYWRAMGEAMRSYGWTGTYHTVSFYKGDTNCNTKILDGTRDDSIRELGRLLAWNIYSSYSKNNISVDVVAHSMGGLVTRAALTGVARKESGWPPYLYIEDVVTLSTPHKGTGLGSACSPVFTQCAEMTRGSWLLNTWLYNAPQSAQGTDWTLVGAEDDDVVDNESAVGMSGAGHTVIYRAGQGIEHDVIPEVTSGSYQQWYWNYYDNKSYWTGSGGPPTYVANNAIYHWWKW